MASLLAKLASPALKRLYRFILRRSLGAFLLGENLDVDQLDVAVSKGLLALQDVQVRAQKCNLRCTWGDRCCCVGVGGPPTGTPT